MNLPPLTTERLTVRRFTPADLDALVLLYDSVGWNVGREKLPAWLDWTMRGHDQYASLMQPPMANAP